ncbi:MAG: calcium-binding EGF-like domain-containing protein [Edaphocola sp.]
MKNWKSILITVFGFFAIGGMVFLNSCVKDPCTDLACRNGGSCSDGLCQCPTGYEGAECEITAASRFLGKWVGSSHCDDFPAETPDTVTVELLEAPNKIKVSWGVGNTSFTDFEGLAETPETHFTTYTSDYVEINMYIRVDAGYMQIYTQSLDKDLTLRQNCYFSGLRLE